MAIYNYEIGGNEIKPDANESIAAIPENRSLIIEQLTDEETVNPNVVTALKTIEEVFAHFKPTKQVEFENAEGQPVSETLHFKSVADYTVKNLTQNSDFLKQINTKQEFFTNLIKQLRSNKVLQRALEDPEAKAAYIAALEGIQAELRKNSNK